MVNKLKLEKKERNKKDKEWRLAVKTKFENRCVICGSPKMLNVHHLIPRCNKIYRNDIMNGLVLCARCHRFSRVNSPHQNPLMFHIWFESHYPEEFNYLKNALLKDVKCY